MIGQKKLLRDIQHIANHSFPRFSIICGQRHGGKKLIVKEIANILNLQIIEVDTKVDSIREVIKLAYKQTSPVIYLIPDADKMSIAAKNALLKVTEEPPQKAYFIMTLIDINNTLPTLKSRGMVFNLDPYAQAELLEYCSENPHLSKREKEVIVNICSVPGEIDELIRYDIISFYEFVQTVIENIGKVNGANAFKIATRFAYKDMDDGWDIGLFFKTIMFVCSQMMRENPSRNLKETIRVTSKYLTQLNLTGVTKSSTVDMWILETRGIWL